MDNMIQREDSLQDITTPFNHNVGLTVRDFTIDNDLDEDDILWINDAITSMVYSQ